MRFPFLLLALFFTHVASAAPTGYLNDTGQTSCYDASNAAVTCDPASANPRQDGRFGRDAAAAAGKLAKTGGGAGGFDYTKVCMSGELAGQGSCPASPELGTSANQWACTKDNVTNLIWLINETPGVMYDWTNASVTYPAATNAAARCGGGDWRLPTRRELLTLVNSFVGPPAIDPTYFGYSEGGNYWSSDSLASDTTQAWTVNFQMGFTGTYSKTTATYWTRLVRDAP